jgi:urea transport system substrate-binding protein
MKYQVKIQIAALAAITALALAGCSATSPAKTNSTPIKIGLLTDLSGVQKLFGTPTKDVSELAVKQINAAGGVNGRKVELVVGDGQATPNVGVAAAQRLISQDGVSALFGMHDSASLHAVIPVTQSGKVPYFYTPLFEGGTCSANLVTNGEVPAQQLKPEIPWVQKQTGNNKWFLLGDDYAWPQQSLKLAAGYIKASGGTVVGTQFVPLGTTDFQSVISQIRASGANLLLPALVGGDAVGFEKQAAAAGLGNSKIQRLALLYENATRAGMGADVANGEYNTMSYDQSVSSAVNTKFLAAYTKEFGASAPPVTSLSEETYVAILAWAEAANKAKSVDEHAVLTHVAGIKIDSPAGTVTFLANHFAKQNINVTQAQPDGSVKVVKTFSQLDPEQTCTTPLG